MTITDMFKQLIENLRIDWINSELKLKFWRDKIPLSMIIAVILIIIAIAYILISNKLTCSFK